MSPYRLYQQAPVAHYHRIGMAILATGDVCYGAALALGPANTPSLALVREVVPVPAVGVALVVAGALVLARRYLLGGIGGSLVWMVFGLAAAITISQGTAPTLGGPVPSLVIAALHGWITYGVTSGLPAKKG